MTPRRAAYLFATFLAVALTATAAVAGAPAAPDSMPMIKIESPMPTLAPIIIQGKEFTTRELVQRAIKGERSKLAGHADATYRVTAHVSVQWTDKKEVETHVYSVYGDSTGYTRTVLLGARAERFKKKGDEWVFDKNVDTHGTGYRINDLDEGRFNSVPVYLEQDQEFDFEFIDRKLEVDHVIFHVRFRPKSDFSELPNGEIWIDGNGFRVVHEIYDFTKNPFPMLIKGVRRISVQWAELPGGEWVPRQIAAEVDLRGMPFMPGTVSFKQVWDEFKFDVGYDAKMYGKREGTPVTIAPKVKPEPARPVGPPETFASLQDTVSEFTGTAVLDSALVLGDTTSALADTGDFNIMDDYLAKLQREDNAAYSPDVEITNRAFIDSTTARHDAMGVAGLDKDIPLYGSDWEFGFQPHLDDWAYNRVEGFLFGGEAKYGRADDRSQLSLFGGYATGSEEFRYHARLKTEIPRTSRKLSLVLTFRNQAEPFGSNQIAMNSLRAFVGGADDQDYLETTAGRAALNYEPVDDLTFDLGVDGAEEKSMAAASDFSVFGDLDEPNPAAVDGDDHALVAGVHRTGELRWFNADVTQRLAGGVLGGDFNYARTDIMLNAHGYVLGRQEFDLTLRGVTTAGRTPFQRQADIGGLTTVRGYDRRTLVGNHSFAARLEYLFPYDVLASTRIPVVEDLGVQLIPWADAGRVGEGTSQDWITSVGFGLQYYLWPVENAANLRLDFAWPLDNPDDDFSVYLWFVGMR